MLQVYFRCQNQPPPKKITHPASVQAWRKPGVQDVDRRGGLEEIDSALEDTSAPVAKYPPLQRPSRRFARYAARKERAALTDASAPGDALS
jgi:hypothetical protein